MTKTDKRVQEYCLFRIRRVSMDEHEWRYTKLASIHAALTNLITLREGELPVVCSWISEVSWYLFTTRRFLCRCRGASYDVPVVGLEEVVGGKILNYKGYRGQETEVMTLRTPNGQQLQLEFETGKASMAPIYALRSLDYAIMHYA